MGNGGDVIWTDVWERAKVNVVNKLLVFVSKFFFVCQCMFDYTMDIYQIFAFLPDCTQFCSVFSGCWIGN